MNAYQRKKWAVCAGSFDPPTVGHEWVIKTALSLFDHLIIAIGKNPLKKPSFTAEERVEMLRDSVKGIDLVKWSVTTYENQFLVNFAHSVGAQFIVRGIRNESDYEYERTMRYLNADRQPDITTVFLIPPRELVEVSSGAVKAMVGPVGWEDFVKPYVSEFVFKKLKENHARKA